jgi:hypothetical protein
MALLSSPPTSPLTPGMEARTRSPGRSSPLRIPDVANIIVKWRRASSNTKDKEYPIECLSGEPITHPVLMGEGVTSARKVPLQEQRRFLCRDGVDAKRLLRTMRASLLEEAQMIGANVLVEEA